MSNDERPDSLAAQAAAWVPPWERPQRPPDRGFQATAESQARAELAAGERDTDPDADPDADIANANAAPGPADSDSDDLSPVARVAGPADDEARSEAGLSDDDDFDPVFEGPPPTEEPALGEDGDERFGVDAPADEERREPVESGSGPELPLPDPIEEAAAAPAQDDDGIPVDAPLPPDGDDAGDVFDAAADDDVSDDGEVDLPFSEEVPGGAPIEDTGAADDPAEAEAEAEAEGEAERDADADADADADPNADPHARADPDSDPHADAHAHTPTGADAHADSDAHTPTGGDASAGKAGSAPVRRAASRAAVGVPGQGRGSGTTFGTPGDASARTPEMDLPGLTDDAELTAALEAIMLVVDEPVAELQLAQILEQPTERIARTLDNLSARYTAAGHGFDLRRVAGGWRLYTRPEYAAYVERFVLDGQSVRLTQAALETLAVVAYKQPVTRSRISAIRGVNCDGVMRTLVTRGLIEECGTEGETGAHLYRTTTLFLEKLGLNSVDQLPPLAPFLPDDVEEVLDASG